MTRFIVSDGTTQAEEEKAKNFVEKLRLTSVSIVELDQNNKPINHGSACVIKYQNELVLLTVAHVVKEWKKWGVESTDLHHGTKVIFTRDVEYDESVDLACATVNDVGSKSFDQGKTISKNLLIIPNWDNEPSNDERYGFSGIVGTNIDEHYPFENPNMVALRGRCQTCALDYIKRTSRFYVFDFVRERPPAAFVKGCSGAPILDEDGDLIALVEGEGEENKEHLNGIPLATCKDFLQRVRG